jgi:ParB family chromosome partitioning protein
VGKSRTAVTNTLRLLGASRAVRQALLDGAITEGHARALLGLPTDAAQDVALQTIQRQRLTVRQTEELVRKWNGRPDARPKTVAEDAPEVKALEARLEQSLGTRVTLRYGRRGGKITIHYYSDEELEALLARLLDE